jgi:hypothetical protein
MTLLFDVHYLRDLPAYDAMRVLRRGLRQPLLIIYLPMTLSPPC